MDPKINIRFTAMKLIHKQLVMKKRWQIMQQNHINTNKKLYGINVFYFWTRIMIIPVLF